MDQENPTAGDSGASITDRIAAHLSAQEAPIQPTGQDSKETEPIAENQVDAEDGESEQSQEPQISTTDVAKWLGADESAIDVDEDGTIKVKTKIDGKEGSVKFADLLKSYQIQGHADNKSREVAERERAVEARKQEVEQQAQAKLQHLEQLGSVAAQELMRDYQSIPWDDLKAQDPGRWAALRQEFQERNGKLQQVFATVRHQTEQQRAQAERQRQEFVQQQAQRLPELIPEWKDKAVAAKETDEIRSWAVKAGFDPSEMDTFIHAHHVQVMRKAMLYDKLQQAKPATENKLRLAPKLVKPGQSQEPDSQAQKLQNLKLAVKKSGGKGGSVAAYLLAKGIV